MAGNRELYVTGYRVGDSILMVKSQNICMGKGKAFWLITGSMMNRQPSIWYDHWAAIILNGIITLKGVQDRPGHIIQISGKENRIEIQLCHNKNYTDFDTTKLLRNIRWTFSSFGNSEMN